MTDDPFGCVISNIHDAGLDPRLWTGVLRSVTEAVGASGAEYIVRDARTGRVDWANFLGPAAKFTSDYIARFAAKDPFNELPKDHEGTWVRLSEKLSPSELRRNEWYTNFVLKSGLKDIVAAQISKAGSHTVVFGVHEGIGDEPLAAPDIKRLDRLLEPLRKAAEVQLRIRELGWRSAVAARAFDQVATGVIVVDAHGYVIEMNRLAERVVSRGDGLTLQHGALGAARVFENAKLLGAITTATRRVPAAASSRILVGRHGCNHDYILAISPLDVDLDFHTVPTALIIVVDPEARSPKAEDLSAYFGLSFAESRLATQLMSGKHLDAIAAESGVAMATLRTQLRSILKKIKVERQADLFLVLARVPSSPDGEAGGQENPPTSFRISEPVL